MVRRSRTRTCAGFGALKIRTTFFNILLVRLATSKAGRFGPLSRKQPIRPESDRL